MIGQHGTCCRDLRGTLFLLMSWCPHSHLLRHVCRQGPTPLSGTVLPPFPGRDSSRRSAAALCLPGPIGCCRTTVPLPVTSQTNRSVGTSISKVCYLIRGIMGMFFSHCGTDRSHRVWGKEYWCICRKISGSFDYGRGRDR